MSTDLSKLDSLRRQIARLKALVEVGRAFSQELSPDALLQLVMQKTTEILEADRSTLLLIDHTRGELWSKIAQELEISEIRFPMHLGLEGYVLRTGETLNVPDAYDNPYFYRDVDQRTGYRTRSVLCMPVRRNDGEIIGVIESLNKLEGLFTAEDEELMGALAAQAAVALRNAQLFEEITFLKNYNESIVHSMSTAVVTLDAGGAVSTANPAAVRIFGLDGMNWRGMALPHLLNGPTNSALVETVSRAVEDGRDYTGYDLKAVNLAEELVSLNIRLLPLRSPSGQTLGFVLVADDISREQRLISAFGRYVERGVIEKVLAQGDQQFLGGIRQRVAVLFSDIRSYTTITEHSPAEAVMSMLNEYFSRMVKQIFLHEGMLDKYIGDAIMAVFGTPITHEDDALRAVRAAVAMRRELWRYNEERVAAGVEPIEIGIGIACGEAISGNVGSVDYVDYTVIGDVVNVASRLEGLTKNYECKILFNEEVFADVRDEIPCVELGLDHVKGRDEALHLFGISDAWIRTVPDELLESWADA